VGSCAGRSANYTPSLAWEKCFLECAGSFVADTQKSNILKQSLIGASSGLHFLGRKKGTGPRTAPQNAEAMAKLHSMILQCQHKGKRSGKPCNWGNNRTGIRKIKHLLLHSCSEFQPSFPYSVSNDVRS